MWIIKRNCKFRSWTSNCCCCWHYHHPFIVCLKQKQNSKQNRDFVLPTIFVWILFMFVLKTTRALVYRCLFDSFLVFEFCFFHENLSQILPKWKNSESFVIYWSLEWINFFCVNLKKEFLFWKYLNLFEISINQVAIWWHVKFLQIY